MKKALLLLLALTIAAGFAACAVPSGGETTAHTTAQATQAPETIDLDDNVFTFTMENYPRLGGSLANLPYGEAVTAILLGISREEANTLVTFDGSTTSNYTRLCDGVFDILLAYEPSDEAIQYAKDAGFEWEMTPIGRDALVFIANAQNPVTGLTSKQILDIYQGRIKNWSEVGGDDEEIIPYQRNPSSGSQTLMDKIFMKGEPMMEAPTERIIGGMEGLIDVVATYDGAKAALGYTVYYYLTNMQSQKLADTKILECDGVAASNQSILDGSYPYTNDFYVVIPKDTPENSPVRILYDWIRSDQGLELMERENYAALR